MDSSTHIIEAQPDWLTVTSGAPDNQSTLHLWGILLLEWERSRAQKVVPWRAHRFQGLQAGSVRWGWSDTRFLLETSGKLAAAAFDSIMPLAGKVTRLDVQVTAQAGEDSAGLAEAAWQGACDAPPRRGKPGYVSRFLDNKTGDTVYLGSPTSLTRARLYNKHAESPTEYPSGAWRYEVQCRGEAGMALAHSLATATDWQLDTRRYVHTYFQRRGVSPAFAAAELRLPPVSGHQRGEVKRILDWYSTQVRPTLGRLIECGYGEQALSALGLDSAFVVAMARRLTEGDCTLN